MSDSCNGALANWAKLRSGELGQNSAVKLLVDSGCHRLVASEAVISGQIIQRQERWSDLPSRVNVGDRLADLVLFCRLPDVTLVDAFISDDEISALIDASTPRLSRSKVVDIDAADGAGIVSEARTSWSMYFERGENQVVRTIERRAAAFAGIDVAYAEPIQVVRYTSGAGVEPHQDFFDPSDASTENIVSKEGQRVATVLIYMRAPISGGETLFSDAQLEICPHEGAAALFFYPSASDADRTLHSSAPVIGGEKWIATVWFRGPVQKMHSMERLNEP